jgi:hypothetical protein
MERYRLTVVAAETANRECAGAAEVAAVEVAVAVATRPRTLIESPQTFLVMPPLRKALGFWSYIPMGTDSSVVPTTITPANGAIRLYQAQ